MAADSLGAHVGPHHHDGGIPADEGTDPSLDVLVTGEPRLLVGRDGVHIGRGHHGGEIHLLGPGALEQLHEQETAPRPALSVHDSVEGVEPLSRLGRVDVGDLVGDPVKEHNPTLPPVTEARHPLVPRRQGVS